MSEEIFEKVKKSLITPIMKRLHRQENELEMKKNLCNHPLKSESLEGSDKGLRVFQRPLEEKIR